MLKKTSTRNFHRCMWPKLCGLIGQLCSKVSSIRNLHQTELHSIRCKFLVQLSWACVIAFNTCTVQCITVAVSSWSVDLNSLPSQSHLKLYASYSSSTICCSNATDYPNNHDFVAEIAQQLLSSVVQLRKSAIAAGLSHRSCTVSCVGWLWQLNRYSAECGATPHSGKTSDMPLVMRALYVFKSWQNATGQAWYGLTDTHYCMQCLSFVCLKTFYCEDRIWF